MKRIIYIVLGLCSIISLAVSCKEEGYSVPANELTDLTFSTFKGTVTLDWGYVQDPDENLNRCVEIRYYDPAVEKDVLKTVSGYTTSLTIENTRAEYGEYTFRLQPFSSTYTPGKEQTISGISEDPDIIPDPDPDPDPDTDPDPDPEQDPQIVSSVEMEITESDLKILGEAGQVTTTGSMASLLDGDRTTSSNSNVVYPWQSIAEDEILSIHVTCLTPQRFLKFTYNNATWSSSRVITELECYVKTNEGDEWTLIATLGPDDGLSQEGKGALSEPEPILAPFEFTYVRLRAVKTTAIGPGAATLAYKAGFCLSEFDIFDVKYTD